MFFYSPNSFAARIDPVSNNSETKGKLTGMVQDLLTLMKKIENLKVVQDFLSTIGECSSVDEKIQKINDILIEKYEINF